MERAVETSGDKKVEMLDGGLVTPTQEKGYARYTLLGAALHTVQTVQRSSPCFAARFLTASNRSGRTAVFALLAIHVGIEPPGSV